MYTGVFICQEFSPDDSAGDADQSAQPTQDDADDATPVPNPKRPSRTMVPCTGGRAVAELVQEAQPELDTACSAWLPYSAFAL